MRRFLRSLGLTNRLFSSLSFFLEIGHIACLLTPISILGFSDAAVYILVALLFVLDKIGRVLPMLAWAAHLIFWIVSVFHIAQCQNLTLYIICAVAYVIVEVLAPLIFFLYLSSSKNSK